MHLNDDDFCLAHLDLENTKEYKKDDSTPCSKPQYHKFEKKLLAQHYYYECSICGYSPDLDFNKDKFKKCHEDYIAWKKDLR